MVLQTSVDREERSMGTGGKVMSEGTLKEVLRGAAPKKDQKPTEGFFC